MVQKVSEGEIVGSGSDGLVPATPPTETPQQEMSRLMEADLPPTERRRLPIEPSALTGGYDAAVRHEAKYRQT